MDKEKEKKVSGEMNEEELENVAGGMDWCWKWSVQKPTLQKNQTLEEDDNTYTIITNYGGSGAIKNANVIGRAMYDSKGNYMGGGSAVCDKLAQQ